MQFTRNFIRLDGTPDKAIVRARKTRLGWIGSISIFNLSRSVTCAYFDSNDALTGALRQLQNYRENAIL